MTQIIEIPITDEQRCENMRPSTWQEWLQCTGLSKNMFTNEQLETIGKNCAAVSEKKVNKESQR